jgi:hypothetical protein
MEFPIWPMMLIVIFMLGMFYSVMNSILNTLKEILSELKK